MRERWGNTEAYRESEKKHYSAQEAAALNEAANADFPALCSTLRRRGEPVRRKARLR